MPRLTKPLLLAGGAAVVILAMVIALVFIVGHKARNPAGGTVVAEADCWGCEPYDRLRSLFELQQLAAEPRIRQFQQRLATQNLTTGDRAAAEAGLELAQARINAATAAIGALDSAVAMCLADVACRRPPDDFQSLTCTGAWPDAATQDHILSLARRIYASGAECRDMSCPFASCEAHANLQGALDELTDTFAAYAASARSPAVPVNLAPQLETLRQALERLPLALSQPNPSSLAGWAASINEGDLLQSTDELSDTSGPEAGWRLRLTRLQIAALVNRAQGADEDDATLDWAQIALRGGAALAQVHYLEWLTSQSPQTSTCEEPQLTTLEDMATELRRAAAALTVCGARAGCGGGVPPMPLADLYSRAPVGLGGLERFTREAVTLIVRNYDALGLRADDPVQISTDLERYGAGEAIRVRFGNTSNRCIAEPGARLGMFDPDGSDRALELRDVRASGDSSEALIAAPERSGVYEIRAFAAPSRGGGELARDRVVIEQPPDGCDGFEGLWDTNFGELRIYVRDGIARGTYGRTAAGAPGFLTGEVRGPVLYGDWDSELGEGGARLVLEDGGASFRGSWSHVPGRYSGTGRWTGTCVGAVDNVE